MGILTCLIALYLLSFMLQVVLFRTKLPKSQTLAILTIYPATLVFFLLARSVGFFESIPLFNLSLIECVYLSAVFLAILPNYVVLYGLIEAESPSSLMVLLLEASAEKGLDRTAFNDLLTNDLFLWHRVTALEKGGYVLMKGDRYFITRKGVFYMHCWLMPRYAIGRKSYGG